MSDETTPTIERVTLLNGYTSPETAYVVDDYPCSFRLRCTIRYWVGTAVNGAAKGQQRFMSQTTNPKVSGTVWNKPKAGTYSPLVGMYLDHNGHVKPWAASFWLSPVDFARDHLTGIYDQLTDDDRDRYDVLIARSRTQATQWREWNTRLDAVVAFIRETGDDPEIVNSAWRAPSGLVYLADPAVYIATARRLLDPTAGCA